MDQINLFDTPAPKPPAGAQPLAERLRPKTLDEFVGQEHLLGRDGALRRLIEVP